MLKSDGFVESASLAEGIRGWAIDRSTSKRPLDVFLFVNDILIAKTQTHIERPDIAGAFGEKYSSSGFHIDCLDFSGIVEAVASDASPQLFVAVGKDRRLIDGAHRSINARLLALEYLQAGLYERSAASDRSVSSVLSAFGGKMDEESALLSLPHKSNYRTPQGTIQHHRFDDRGRLWISGRSTVHLPDFAPVVIVSKSKALGMALFDIDQDNLTDEGAAFRGVVNFSGAVEIRRRSPWSISLHSEPRLDFVGAESIEALNPSDADLWTSHRAANGGEASLNPYSAFSLRNTPWSPSRQTEMFRAAVDQAVFLPSFGLIVELWVLSPIRTVASLCLRCGDKIATTDSASIDYVPRPDLSEAFGLTPEASHRSGMRVVFPISAAAKDLASSIIKVTFSDGSSECIAIDPKVIGTLGVSHDVEKLYERHPKLPRHWLHSAFVKALCLDAMSTLSVERNLWKGGQILTSGPGIFIRLPFEKSELFFALVQFVDCLALMDAESEINWILLIDNQDLEMFAIEFMEQSRNYIKNNTSVNIFSFDYRNSHSGLLFGPTAADIIAKQLSIFQYSYISQHIVFDRLFFKRHHLNSTADLHHHLTDDITTSIVASLNMKLPTESSKPPPIPFFEPLRASDWSQANIIIGAEPVAARPLESEHLRSRPSPNHVSSHANPEIVRLRSTP